MHTRDVYHRGKSTSYSPVDGNDDLGLVVVTPNGTSMSADFLLIQLRAVDSAKLMAQTVLEHKRVLVSNIFFPTFARSSWCVHVLRFFASR